MARTLAAVPDLERELDSLYGGPLAAFTSARNDLARRLQRAGQADAAEQIRALKKPSVAVWAVNQLARRHPDLTGALLEAGERLRRAQKLALGGQGGGALRDATAAEREAVSQLTRAAQVLLKSEGRSASAQVIERVASTLRTAAVHPDAARLVASGRLAGELDSPGFAAVAELAPPTRVKDGRRSSDTAEKRRRESERRRLEGHIERLERNLAAEEERADRAERTAAELRERVADVRAQLETARRELKQLAARS